MSLRPSRARSRRRCQLSRGAPLGCEGRSAARHWAWATRTLPDPSVEPYQGRRCATRVRRTVLEGRSSLSLLLLRQLEPCLRLLIFAQRVRCPDRCGVLALYVFLMMWFPPSSPSPCSSLPHSPRSAHYARPSGTQQRHEEGSSPPEPLGSQHAPLQSGENTASVRFQTAVNYCVSPIKIERSW